MAIWKRSAASETAHMKTPINAWWKASLAGFCLASFALTGCQVDVGGQTLPSAYYLEDDVQYFPPGHEMKLQGEATAIQRYRAEQQLQNTGARP